MASTMTAQKRPLDPVEEVPVVKRGRGRPRKNFDTSVAPSKDPNAPKRPRGRPRKNLDASVNLSQQLDKPKRGRGRPRKIADASVPMQADMGASLARSKKSNANNDASSPATKKTARPAKNNALLSSIIGTYDISCEEVEENWDHMAEDMSMSITTIPHINSAVTASFSLGILEGTMLLAVDKATLEAVRANLENGAKYVTSNPQFPALKDGCVYFMWRGRDAGESNQVYPGSYGEQTGILKFKDSKCKSFKGEGSFPSLGPRCAFTGEKVDESTYQQPEPWNNFDEDAYEQANRSRWG